MAAEIRLNFDVAGLGQSTSSTCWYACYRMLHKWKKADDSQIKTKLEGIGLKWAELTTRGLYKEELVRAGHSLGLMGVAVDAAQTWTYDDMKYRMEKWGPLWCAVDLVDDGDSTPTHAVCVYGIKESMNHVLIHDPYKRPYDGDPEKEIWTLSKWKSKLVATPFCIQVWM